jgi:hypothetical protein
VQGHVELKEMFICRQEKQESEISKKKKGKKCRVYPTFYGHLRTDAGYVSVSICLCEENASERIYLSEGAVYTKKLKITAVWKHVS